MLMGLKNLRQLTCNTGILVGRYLHDGQATTKSDVYAFGVVLFELISGKEAIARSKGVVPNTPERRTLVSIVSVCFKVLILWLDNS
jgi:hypothetical protein